MNRYERFAVHASVTLVGGTGVIYAWMLYWLSPIDEFSILHHPQQALLQHGHVWLAPLLVFAVGLIFHRHVWSHLRSGRRQSRRSGVTLLVVLAPMILSGYLIQTAVSDRWRGVWVAVHVTTSALFLSGYLVHWLSFLAWRRRRRASADQAH